MFHQWESYQDVYPRWKTPQGHNHAIIFLYTEKYFTETGIVQCALPFKPYVRREFT